MKKAVILFIFIFAVATITSCKAAKGCGLTGDTDIPILNSLENIISMQTFTA